MKFIAAVATAMLAGAPALAQPVLSAEQLFERLSPSIWTVHTLDADQKPLALGSAVVVGPGSLVTNCHVLRKARSVSVGQENVSYGATLEHADPERDLCMLKVRNFTAPAVTIVGPEEVKVGARVYAIGSPRGMEQTISDGLLSGIRRTEDGDFTALQVTVPISPGSSGGGLFDARGRLLGIMTFQLRDAQNLNFALPASWIAQVPQRSQVAMAAASQQRDPVSARGSAHSAPAGRSFEYRVTDRQTGRQQVVVLHAEREGEGELSFNGGARVETASGRVKLSSALVGELDNVTPPEGWMPNGHVPTGSWKMRYRSIVAGSTMRYELNATVEGEQPMTMDGREWNTVRVRLKGWAENATGLITARASYQATAWLSPELGRVVRYEVRSRASGNTGGAQFSIDELTELVHVARD